MLSVMAPFSSEKIKKKQKNPLFLQKEMGKKNCSRNWSLGCYCRRHYHLGATFLSMPVHIVKHEKRLVFWGLEMQIYLFKRAMKMVEKREKKCMCVILPASQNYRIV
jgi:hypothetical protein